MLLEHYIIGFLNDQLTLQTGVLLLKSQQLHFFFYI